MKKFQVKHSQEGTKPINHWPFLKAPVPTGPNVKKLSPNILSFQIFALRPILGGNPITDARLRDLHGAIELRPHTNGPDLLCIRLFSHIAWRCFWTKVFSSWRKCVLCFIALLCACDNIIQYFYKKKYRKIEIKKGFITPAAYL